MGRAILKIKDLTKCYPGGFTLQIPSLEFEEGLIYALVGPNGAGKTTLLNLINLLERPDKGEIFFREQSSSRDDPTGRLYILWGQTPKRQQLWGQTPPGPKIKVGSDPKELHRKMTLVMENPLLFKTTVFKNIEYGLKVRSVNKKTRQKRVKEMLEAVELGGFEKRPALSLSRGETQRVAIARALVLKPEVLLLDEPFTNIDKRSLEVTEKLIKEINRKEHLTIIFTTHDFRQAYRLSGQVISLLEGKVVKGSLENLFRGEIEENLEGLKYVKLSPKVSVAVVTKKGGEVHISIPPEDIILSPTQLQSSARNSFLGRIKKIDIEDQTVRVSVDIGVEIISLITKESFDELGLTISSSIFITFKSTSVMVI
ncbi:MAG: hypothetical protein COS84_00930 [Armatimonadetes bacterium CG07_land_8_20_14_0_80_40_9]|nr:MAG: hypothetical protein COS84_00930 [Armatimonadetes bacterium CG07_land_8_20_14_0_80_40_9]